MIDEDDLERALRAWSSPDLPTAGRQVSALVRVGGGWESEVFGFALTSESDPSDRQDLVLRAYQGAGSREKAAREFEVMRRLGAAGYPVPRVYLCDALGELVGRPCIVMERVDGQTLAATMAQSPERRERLADEFVRLFVRLHQLDWRDLVADPSAFRAEGFLDRWLDKARAEVLRLGKHGFENVFGWLVERAAEVGDARLALVHWDYHPHNVLVDPDGRPFVIDWTSATVADYRFDLAWTLVLIRSYDGQAARDAVLAGYERWAGHRVEQIEYFEVIAALRRLFSIAVSLLDGAEKLGMQPEAETQMRAQPGAILAPYLLVGDLTGLRIPEVEAVLTQLGVAF